MGSGMLLWALHWSLLFSSGAMGKFVSVKVISPEAVANDYGCMPAQFSGVRTSLMRVRCLSGNRIWASGAEGIDARHTLFR